MGRGEEEKCVLVVLIRWSASSVQFCFGLHLLKGSVGRGEGGKCVLVISQWRLLLLSSLVVNLESPRTGWN